MDVQKSEFQEIMSDAELEVLLAERRKLKKERESTKDIDARIIKTSIRHLDPTDELFAITAHMLSYLFIRAGIGESIDQALREVWAGLLPGGFTETDYVKTLGSEPIEACKKKWASYREDYLNTRQLCSQLNR